MLLSIGGFHSAILHIHHLLYHFPLFLSVARLLSDMETQWGDMQNYNALTLVMTHVCS